LSLTVFAHDKLQLTSRHISTTDGLAGTTEQLLWISTSIYTNACYDLRKKQFIDWTDDAERQLNKFYLF
jgi:hypothetical protein